MRDLVTTVGEIVGAALIVLGIALVSTWFARVSAGVLLCFFSYMAAQ